MKPCTMAIWIDEREAHVFHVDNESVKSAWARAPDHVLRHPRFEPALREPAQDDHRFFAAVAQSLAGAREVLVMGPSNVRFHFRDYIGARGATLSFRIVGVETVDRPTNKQVATFIRDYFAPVLLPAAPAHGAQ